MMQFITKTKPCPYEIKGGQIIFKNLDEPFENYHRVILNYPTMSVYFSFSKCQNIIFTKNIICVRMLNCDSGRFELFPKHMLCVNIEANSTQCLCLNKYIKRMYAYIDFENIFPIKLSKNMTLWSSKSSFLGHDCTLNSKLITLYYNGDKQLVLPKNLRYLTLHYGFSSIHKILFPPNLKFLHVHPFYFKNKSAMCCFMTLKNPLTSFVVMEAYSTRNEYMIDHIDTIKHVYIHSQTEIPNKPRTSIVHYHPNDSVRYLTKNEDVILSLIVSAFIFEINIVIVCSISMTFRESIFYDMTSEFLHNIFLSILIIALCFWPRKILS